MKTLAIIGSNGMLGSDLVRYLGKTFDIKSINKENYQTYIGQSFDVVINANGNSKRFWANENPTEDFSASTSSVISSIFDFPCDLYVYFSSPDVYESHNSPEHTTEDQTINSEKLSPYGFHKYLAELIVKKYAKKFIILRPAMILGSNLRKGPIYDALQSKPLFVTLETKLQLITTKVICEIIKIILERSLNSIILNIGGRDNFNFTKIQDYFDQKIKISEDAKTQTYMMNVKKLKSLYPTLKTSEEYLLDFLKDNNLK
ncbi:MAG: NAD-dependent epimerase/dehydratase family protein [Candidatus Daviesbacteria bacterium]|nr:NAD-dependent epimerase/dehydratase family protein [Candidatus Daviesbacteria bacterium]